MNPKVVNLIALELGVLIALTAWLSYSQFPFRESRSAAKRDVSSGVPAAPPLSDVEAGNQSPDNEVNYADTEQGRRAQEAQVAAEERYAREIAPKRYVNSTTYNRAVNAPAYTEAYQQPAVLSSDEGTAPQGVVYAQPTQVIAYAEPIQTIVFFNNTRRCRDRERSKHCIGLPPAITPQCPDRRGLQVNHPRIVPPPVAITPPAPILPVPRSQSVNARQTGATGVQQDATQPKRVSFVASQGTAGRSVP